LTTSESDGPCRNFLPFLPTARNVKTQDSSVD
jgi:hypothetical protein